MTMGKDLPGQELSKRRAQERDLGGRQRLPARDHPDATSLRSTSATGAGTVLAALALQEFETFDTTNVRTAIERVAARLGNTPPICRQCQRRAPLAAPPLDRFGPARSSRIEPPRPRCLQFSLCGLFPARQGWGFTRRKVLTFLEFLFTPEERSLRRLRARRT